MRPEFREGECAKHRLCAENMSMYAGVRGRSQAGEDPVRDRLRLSRHRTGMHAQYVWHARGGRVRHLHQERQRRHARAQDSIRPTRESELAVHQR